MPDCSCSNCGGEPVAFVCGEPVGVGGTVGKEAEGNEAKHDCGDAFEEEEPLPAAQTKQAIELHEGAGDRRADESGHGRGGHKQGGNRRAMMSKETSS